MSQSALPGIGNLPPQSGRKTAADSVSHNASELTAATVNGLLLAVHEADKKTSEIGGRGGLEPTRFGDWEKNGRCIDF